MKFKIILFNIYVYVIVYIYLLGLIRLISVIE